ncbi:M28 family peptidase [Paenibacillus filicis]|uniref:M28 family peptidase n=1 Tax=Paenibacillus filicis TaxID=669464 RepID=A0ABU9DFU1_9BACL
MTLSGPTSHRQQPIDLEQTHPLNELLAEVSGERLEAYARRIAAEVRLSGSEEELRAFDYVRRTLEDFGLSTKLLFSDAYISLPKEAELLVNGVPAAAITHSMTPSTDWMDSELVGLDPGLPADAPQLAAVRGRTVLTAGIANPVTVRKLQQAGAAAVVFVNPGEYAHEMIVSSVWGSPAPGQTRDLPGIPVISVNAPTGSRLREQLDATGKPLPVRLRTAVETGWTRIPTLIAELRGEEEPDKFVLFSGHIDSWHYGAMDNGSANAVMLEVARILAEQRPLLRRSLRLAFWSGHSHGRYAGSAWYSDEHWDDLHEHGVLHLNIDSVGAKGATQLAIGSTMAQTRELSTQAIRIVTGQSFEGTRFGRSGDQSFWGAGLPSAFMGLSFQPEGWFGWWWHTTEDTLDKLDPANLIRDAKIYLASAYLALSSPVLPLDQLAAVRELRRFIEDYQEQAEARLDLSRLAAQVQLLEELTERFHGQLSRLQLPAPAAEEVGHRGLRLAINEILHRLSQILVPAVYVCGSVFEHDPATPQPPIPSLQEIGQLAAAPVGSDAYYELRTLLVRRVNALHASLKQATALVRHGLELFGEANREEEPR